MFSPKTNKPNDIETIIGPSVKVKGNFNGQGNIIIEGELVGSIKTDQVFFGGENSFIKGDVAAHEAKVAGKILGNLKIKDYIEVLNSANIQGDIECGVISLEKGAIFNGRCIITSENMKKHEKKEDSAK